MFCGWSFRLSLSLWCVCHPGSEILFEYLCLFFFFLIHIGYCHECRKFSKIVSRLVNSFRIRHWRLAFSLALIWINTHTAHFFFLCKTFDGFAYAEATNKWKIQIILFSIQPEPGKNVDCTRTCVMYGDWWLFLTFSLRFYFLHSCVHFINDCLLLSIFDGLFIFLLLLLAVVLLLFFVSFQWLLFSSLPSVIKMIVNRWFLHRISNESTQSTNRHSRRNPRYTHTATNR